MGIKVVLLSHSALISFDIQAKSKTKIYSFLTNKVYSSEESEGGKTRAMPNTLFSTFAHSQISSHLVLKQVTGQGKESFRLFTSITKSKAVHLADLSQNQFDAQNAWIKFCSIKMKCSQAYEKVKMTSSLTYKTAQR